MFQYFLDALYFSYSTSGYKNNVYQDIFKNFKSHTVSRQFSTTCCITANIFLTAVQILTTLEIPSAIWVKCFSKIPGRHLRPRRQNRHPLTTKWQLFFLFPGSRRFAIDKQLARTKE